MGEALKYWKGWVTNVWNYDHRIKDVSSVGMSGREALWHRSSTRCHFLHSRSARPIRFVSDQFSVWSKTDDVTQPCHEPTEIGACPLPRRGNPFVGRPTGVVDPQTKINRSMTSAARNRCHGQSEVWNFVTSMLMVLCVGREQVTRIKGIMTSLVTGWLQKTWSDPGQKYHVNSYDCTVWL